MGGATREFFLQVLREALQIIRDAGADHLVIGGLATRVLLETPLREHEDIDVLIRPGDAEQLVDTFAKSGYATHRRDERWIYKAARPDVTIDLIFRAGEIIELDDEHLARSSTSTIEGVEIPLAAPEDLAVIKALFDSEDRQERWYGALKILRTFPIDWGYIVERGSASAPRRVLSLLLYAKDEGIDVPDDAISRLVPLATS